VQVKGFGSTCFEHGVVRCIDPLRVQSEQTGADINVERLISLKTRPKQVLFGERVLEDQERLGNLFSPEGENVVQVIVSGAAAADALNYSRPETAEDEGHV